jgi:hypothetical protein
MPHGGSYGDAHYSQITGIKSILCTLASQLTSPFDFTHHYSNLSGKTHCTCVLEIISYHTKWGLRTGCSML